MLQAAVGRAAGLVPGVPMTDCVALVVPDLLPERAVPVDDLLRRADGQRGLAREVLHRRAVAVDGGVVEVRAELVPRLLRVLAHEDLAAEPDDRLVGAAVAVVLVAPAVEVHHLRGVLHGPEDRVVQEPVAVVRGLLGDLGRADGAVPHERRDAVERARRRGEALQRRAERAGPVDDVLGPQAAQQRVVLDREGDALADVLAEPRVDRAGVAAAHHEVHPAVGDDLEHRVLLGQPDRVVRRDERRRGGQRDLLRDAREVAEHRGGGGRDERRVVVLAGREDVEARLVGVLRDREHRAHALGVVRRAAGGRVGGHVADGEDAELHRGSPRFAGPGRSRRPSDSCVCMYCWRQPYGGKPYSPPPPRTHSPCPPR